MSVLKSFLMQKQNIMYATIKGTLTENDGVFSGFSASNYLQLQQNLDSDNLEMVIDFTTGNVINAYETIFLNRSIFDLEVNYTKALTSYNWENSSYEIVIPASDFLINTNYKVKIKRNGNTISFAYSKNGSAFIDTTSFTTTKLATNLPCLGNSSVNTSRYFNGSIDLPNSYIKIGATKYNLQAVVGYTVVGSPTITDGVVSGFSSSDYLTLPSYSGTINSLEFVVKVNTIPTTITNNALILQLTGGPINIYVRTNSQITMGYKDETNTTRYLNSLEEIKIGYYKFVLNSSGAFIYYSANGSSWELLNSYSYTTTILINGGKIGYATSTYNVYDGSLDIGKSFSKINNKLWFNGQQA